MFLRILILMCALLTQGGSLLATTCEEVLGSLEHKDRGIPIPPGLWQRTFSGMKVGARSLEIKQQELDSDKLTPEQEEEILVKLIRFTGYVPEVVVRKKIVLEHEMAIAYPFKIGEELWRLVVEYRYVPAMSSYPDYEGQIPSAVPAMLIVEEIALVSPNATLTDAMVLLSRKTPTLVVVNGNAKPRLAEAQELIDAYWKRAGKIAEGEGKHRKEVVEGSLRELVMRVQTLASTDSNERLLMQIELLAQPLADEEPIIAKHLPTLAKKHLPFTVFTKITGPIIDKYRSFMAKYLFTANRNSMVRPLEELQKLTSVEEYRALGSKVFWGNMYERFKERSGRKALGMPMGIALGLAIAWGVGGWNALPSPQDSVAEKFPPAIAIEDVEKRDLEIRYHDNAELEFLPVSNDQLVPLNPNLPLWHEHNEQNVDLEDTNGLRHRYHVQRMVKGDGDVSVVLTRS